MTDSIGGSKGGHEGRPPPRASKFFQFHDFCWENLAKSCVGGLSPQPRGNNGSATGFKK